MRPLYMITSVNMCIASSVWVACRWPTRTPCCDSMHFEWSHRDVHCSRQAEGAVLQHVPRTVGTATQVLPYFVSWNGCVKFCSLGIGSSCTHLHERIVHAADTQTLHTDTHGKHGRCAARAGAPTCLGLASMVRCNRAGLLWRLPVEAVVSTRCTHREGRCCLFLEDPDLHMR